MVPDHIKSADDLRTPYEQTQAGFLAQAIAKAEKAEPYIKAAMRLRTALKKVKSIQSLAANELLEDDLFAAAGFSDKSCNHLDRDKRKKVLAAILTKLAETSPDLWRDELVYRFLLTRGDSLGGSMRNWIGAEASRNLAAAVEEALKRKGLAYVEDPSQREGLTYSVSKTAKGKVTAIEWPDRALLVDRKSQLPELGNNIDMHLLNTNGTNLKPVELTKEHKRYLALGELKGGIDPAGADEHWKTGNTAIGRIRASFSKAGAKVRLFLVAAAIEKAMADEIYKLWQNGELDYAANLTIPQQMGEVCRLARFTELGRRQTYTHLRISCRPWAPICWLLLPLPRGSTQIVSTSKPACCAMSERIKSTGTWMP